MPFLKLFYFVATLALGSMLVAFFGFNNSPEPLFNNLDDFIIFTEEEATLEQEVQISSGDIGSNNTIDINKDSLINGDLFADSIILDRDTQINGNISFNNLKTKKETQIFGDQTTSISLPVANIPQIPDFNTGQDNITFKGDDNTLQPGDFNNIVFEIDAKLILTGGIYNINRLQFKKNTILIFNQPTILNIKDKLTARERTSILPGPDITQNDLIINFNGAKLIHFGKQSFLNFKLLSPDATIRLGEDTTFRGQIIAERAHIAKGSVLSREDVFEEESDPGKIVEDEGIRFIVNEIIVLFDSGATLADAQAVAGLVDGRITGFVPEPPISKIEVKTNIASELNSIIDIIKSSNNPLIIEVVPNLIGEPIL